MSLRTAFYPVPLIRSVEQELLDAQSHPDQLMRQAAAAVAAAAQAMVSPGTPVLLLVGAGGNGGDALYAGASLCADHPVEAVLLGRGGRVHQPALAAFRDAGGQVREGLPEGNVPHGLVIDGVLGLGGSGGLSPELGEWLRQVAGERIPVLAVDVPSGVDADTGAAAEHHVTADVTVTFGALRPAHAVSPACGEVLVTDIGLPDRSLGGELARRVAKEDLPRMAVHLAVPSGNTWPAGLHTLIPHRNPTPLEPAPTDDKYSGGVVGLCAGSRIFPGAALLTTQGAVHATSSMVRYVGEQKHEVVRVVPEIVISDDITDTDRVQAWVVGPGRGIDHPAHEELADLLIRPEALLIDADALTLLARNAPLRVLLRERRGLTLLTPHEGEFRRLVASVGGRRPDPASDRIGAVRSLARDLGCAVLLKGRHTVIALPGPREDVHVIDTGSSWAATPGSGDVLAGIAGAWLARAVMQDPGRELLSCVDAVQVHSEAAWLAAQTPDGPAPTTAGRIAGAVPRATARLGAEGPSGGTSPGSHAGP